MTLPALVLSLECSNEVPRLDSQNESTGKFAIASSKLLSFQSSSSSSKSSCTFS